MRTAWTLCIVAVVVVSCGKTQPQRPSFHGEQSMDTTLVQLLTMNQQMAQQADLQLAHVATSDFVLMDENYWVKGLTNPDNRTRLQEGEYVDIQAQFFSLKDQLYSTHQASVLLGQVDEIQAIVDILPLMQRGEHVTLLVPWYLAFGSAGNLDVPPFENLRVELSVHE